MSNASHEPAKRDLVLDAIAHKDTGRIPFWVLFDPTIGNEMAKYYGVMSIYEVADNSIEWISNTLSLSAMKDLGLLQRDEYTDEWGARWQGVGETRGQVKTPPIREPSLKGYRFPKGLNNENISAMKAQAQKSGHKYRLAKLGALWEQATFLRGMANLLLDLIEHPGFVHELLDRILEVLLANVELYGIELDLDGIHLSDDYGSQHNLLMSPRMWREFILTPGLTIQNEVPVENAVAFLETALEREKG